MVAFGSIAGVEIRNLEGMLDMVILHDIVGCASTVLSMVSFYILGTRRMCLHLKFEKGEAFCLCSF